MKIIRHHQYERIRKELTAYAGSITDTTGYLYLLINGRARGEQRTEAGPKKLLSAKQISDAWRSDELRGELIRLAVLRHYKGCIVWHKPTESLLVRMDNLLTYALTLKTKIKNI